MIKVNAESPKNVHVHGYVKYFVRVSISQDQLLSGLVGPACVEFAYHMYSNYKHQMGALEMFYSRHDERPIILWAVEGHQHHYWLVQRLNVVFTGGANEVCIYDINRRVRFCF